MCSKLGALLQLLPDTGSCGEVYKISEHCKMNSCITTTVLPALGRTQILLGPSFSLSNGEMYAFSKRRKMDSMYQIIVVLPALGRTHELPDTGSCGVVYAVSNYSTMNTVPMCKHRTIPITPYMWYART